MPITVTGQDIPLDDYGWEDGSEVVACQVTFWISPDHLKELKRIFEFCSHIEDWTESWMQVHGFVIQHQADDFVEEAEPPPKLTSDTFRTLRVGVDLHGYIRVEFEEFDKFQHRIESDPVRLQEVMACQGEEPCG